MTDRETVIAALRDEIRAEALECRRYAGVPCQSEYLWHAERYESWADRLDTLLQSTPASHAEKADD